MVAFFILFGILIKQSIDFLRAQKICILIVLFIITFCGSFLFSLNNSVSYVLVAEGIYGNPLLFLISAIIGIYMVLIASFILDKFLYTSIKNCITYIGKNSFIIFAFQRFTLTVTSDLLYKIGVNLSTVSIILIHITTTLVFSLLVAKLSAHFFPQLNGNVFTQNTAI